MRSSISAQSCASVPPAPGVDRDDRVAGVVLAAEQAAQLGVLELAPRPRSSLLPRPRASASASPSSRQLEQHLGVVERLAERGTSSSSRSSRRFSRSSVSARSRSFQSAGAAAPRARLARRARAPQGRRRSKMPPESSSRDARLVERAHPRRGARRRPQRIAHAPPLARPTAPDAAAGVRRAPRSEPAGPARRRRRGGRRRCALRGPRAGTSATSSASSKIGVCSRTRPARVDEAPRRRCWRRARSSSRFSAERSARDREELVRSAGAPVPGVVGDARAAARRRRPAKRRTRSGKSSS